jgi:hypothetical protein
MTVAGHFYCEGRRRKVLEPATKLPGKRVEQIRRAVAIATEARRAGTVKQGPVHEGAGPKDIAQNQSAHKRLGDG